MTKKTGAFLLIFSLLCTLLYPAKNIFAKDPKYHIKVNRLANTVTVYEQIKGEYQPVKAMLCGSGGKLTPLGTFYTKQKREWNPFFAGSFGQYATRITGHYLFHSLPYNKKSPGTMIRNTFQRLGTVSSEGCVRLAAIDAKWIFDNCPLGTKVTIYESKDPGPLGKPDPYPYPTENGYDPTDIWAKGNPILKHKPKITIQGDLIVKPDDSEVDLMKDVKAVSSFGLDISDDVEIEDDIDYSMPGSYTIIYRVKDILGKKAVAKRTVIIEE